MNDNDNTTPSEDDGFPTDRPLGFWLRTVDRLITREFAAALAAEGVDRRDWMLLNLIAGDVDAPGAEARLSRGGKRLRGLEDRGWIDEVEGSWTLTDAGRAAKERLGGIVSGIRSRVAGAVSAEDFATMTASLEAIARHLGWDENASPAWRGRGFGPGRGRGWGRGFAPRFAPWGPGFGHGRSPWDADHAGHPDGGQGPSFGPGFGVDHGSDFGPFGHAYHGHGDHHGHHGDHSERAYERGFRAGFTASRSGGPDAESDAA